MKVIYTKTNSGGNCTIIQHGSIRFMIDAGINPKLIHKESGERLSQINYCFITHAHLDHTQYLSEVLKYNIWVYMSVETFNYLNLKVNPYKAKIKIVDIKQILTLNNFWVILFNLPHYDNNGEPMNNYGFAFVDSVTNERLLYCTDCAYIKYIFPPCDIYMIECNYYDIEDTSDIIPMMNLNVEKRRLRSHMSVQMFIKFFKEQDFSKCNEIYLLHISENFSPDKMVGEIQESLKLEEKNIKLCCNTEGNNNVNRAARRGTRLQ